MKNKTTDLIENSQSNSNIQVELDTTDLLLGSLACKEEEFNTEKSRDSDALFEQYKSLANEEEVISVSISNIEPEELEFSSKMVDFCAVYPDETLKSSVTLFNNSERKTEITVKMAEDPDLSAIFSGNKVFNYNLKYSCFSLDKATEEIEPYSSLTVTVLFKCPSLKKEKNIHSAVKITSTQGSHLIPVRANVILPKILILKSESTSGTVPLVKLNSTTETFKIPLKNGNLKDITLKTETRTSNLELIIPETVHISALSTQIVTVKAVSSSKIQSKGVITLSTSNSAFKYSLFISFE